MTTLIRNQSTVALAKLVYLHEKIATTLSHITSRPIYNAVLTPHIFSQGCNTEYFMIYNIQVLFSMVLHSNFAY